MPRLHRKWQVVLAYFRDIPIHNNIIKTIRYYLKEDKNVLIMINRENPNTNPKFTSDEKHRALFEEFRNESIKGTITISIVPEIDDFTKINL